MARRRRSSAFRQSPRSIVVPAFPTSHRVGCTAAVGSLSCSRLLVALECWPARGSINAYSGNRGAGRRAGGVRRRGPNRRSPGVRQSSVSNMRSPPPVIEVALAQTKPILAPAKHSASRWNPTNEPSTTSQVTQRTSTFSNDKASIRLVELGLKAKGK
jgi:hypothetical protein